MMIQRLAPHTATEPSPPNNDVSAGMFALTEQTPYEDEKPQKTGGTQVTQSQPAPYRGHWWKGSVRKNRCGVVLMRNFMLHLSRLTCVCLGRGGPADGWNGTAGLPLIRNAVAVCKGEKRQPKSARSGERCSPGQGSVRRLGR